MEPIEQDNETNWHWTGYCFKAMNTSIQTWLYSQVDGAVLDDVQRLFQSFEKRLSRFDPKSELSRLNTNEREVVQVSPILLDAVEVALMAAAATAGLYDPAILPLLEQAGYDRSFEKIEQAIPLPLGEVSHASPPPANGTTYPLTRSIYSFRSVSLNRARREIQRPVGLRLDLGGMGKGWTVDRAAERLQGLGPFLVNAGGDLYAYHSPPGQKGWQIDLIHPWQSEAFIARVQLHHRALATSTIARRRWQRQGQVMHHLIDPRTGGPAQTDAVSVSVIADRTVMAEIYAKVALMLGVEQGLAYLQSLPQVEGLIYTVTSEIVYTPGLADFLEWLEPAGYVSELPTAKAGGLPVSANP
jgi:FAD:protein FMN transferase